MKKTILNFILILVLLLIVVLFIDDQLVKNRRSKINQTEINRQNLVNCIDLTDTRSNQRWANECGSRGLNDNCRLPNSVADDLRALAVSDRISCQEIYK